MAICSADFYFSSRFLRATTGNFDCLSSLADLSTMLCRSNLFTPDAIVEQAVPNLFEARVSPAF